MQITTLPKDDVKRGEIYYISRGGYNTGSEQQADRPGVIVRDAEIRKIEDLPAYEDRKFYIAAKMQVEPEEVEKVIRKTEAEWNLSPDKAAETLKMISDAAVKLNMAFTEMMENIRQVADKISEVFRRIHENNTMTETQIRKRELWRRYYEEKSRMSNNERRRRGIPMVKRPKRQQYRPPKKKTTKG